MRELVLPGCGTPGAPQYGVGWAPQDSRGVGEFPDCRGTMGWLIPQQFGDSDPGRSHPQWPQQGPVECAAGDSSVPLELSPWQQCPQHLPTLPNLPSSHLAPLSVPCMCSPPQPPLPGSPTTSPGHRCHCLLQHPGGGWTDRQTDQAPFIDSFSIHCINNNRRTL